MNTPTPFTTSPAIEDNIACIYDRERRQIARVMNTSLLGNDSEETAEFIVTACNAYAADQRAIVALQAEIARLRKEVPTADAIIWRKAANDARATLAQQAEQIKALKQWLGVVLDCVDYTRGNCSLNEMIAAVLPREIIEQSRTALEKE